MVKHVSGDAISSLPDETLAQILSKLATKQAASTSILSKRWRNLFPLMNHLFASQHHLDFDHSEFLNPKQGEKKLGRRRKKEIEESFRAFVDKTLCLPSRNNNNNKIKKFSLKCRDKYHDMAQTNRWIKYALERDVSELDLRIKTDSIGASSRPLPSEIFTSKTLVKLTLGTYISVGDISPKVLLPVLKYLSLDTVYVFDGEFYYDMMQGCPALEELVFNYVDINHYNAPEEPNCISHKTLKRLTMRTNLRLMILDTPSLVYLDYSENTRCIFHSATFIESLVEARLDLAGLTRQDHSDHPNLSKVIGWIINARTLYFSSNTVEVIYSYWKGCRFYDSEFPRFGNLLKLSFESKTKQGWEVLTIMLKNSPKLETLVLKGLHFINSTHGVCVKENTVKVLEINDYRGSLEELGQLERFLRQTDFLQVIKLQIDAQIKDDDKKLQLTKDDLLDLLLKCESSCQIQFV
ncbi:unnamed protein product [Thlaspi arvense]|uniref:F-box domain-containing protein n=1 Tax=Thlaspi arvense TaxID=13288 RepID=A0AAU9T0F8_THLAR|nr:unnamed protein product [Thlaspi arvense]